MHHEQSERPQPTTTPPSIMLPLVVVVVATLVTQLCSLACTYDGRFLTILVPSALVLSLITVPLAITGLSLGQRIGLGAPLLTSLLNRDPGSGRWLVTDAKLSISLGLSLGTLLLLLRYVALPFLPPELPALGHRGVLGGLFVSIGAAVGEEVWLRLGVLTILAWGFLWVIGSREVSQSVGWVSVVISAIAFAAIHLPQLASHGAANGIGIMATMAGNTVVGILFGYLYWRRSLLAAVLAHFAVDIVLHVVSALMA